MEYKETLLPFFGNHVVFFWKRKEVGKSGRKWKRVAVDGVFKE
jgi:hypothetical protein